MRTIIAFVVVLFAGQVWAFDYNDHFATDATASPGWVEGRDRLLGTFDGSWGRAVSEAAEAASRKSLSKGFAKHLPMALGSFAVLVAAGGLGGMAAGALAKSAGLAAGAAKVGGSMAASFPLGYGARLSDQAQRRATVGLAQYLTPEVREALANIERHRGLATPEEKAIIDHYWNAVMADANRPLSAKLDEHAGDALGAAALLGFYEVLPIGLLFYLYLGGRRSVLAMATIMAFAVGTQEGTAELMSQYLASQDMDTAKALYDGIVGFFVGAIFGGNAGAWRRYRDRRAMRGIGETPRENG